MQETVRAPRGRVKFFHVEGGLWLPATAFRSNILTYGWAEVAARRLSGTAANYVARTMYLEFENVASPGDPVTAPTPVRNEDVTYYTSLSSPRDYLRVPMLATDIKSSDETGLTAPKNNIAVFLAQSSGTLGENGLTFSDTVNSKVYGVAIVASPDQGDPSQDIVIARYYPPTAEQQLKSPTGQIGVNWEIVCE